MNLNEKELFGYLCQASSSGLVRSKQYKEKDLVVFKYMPAVMYKNLWNPTLINFARGHVFQISTGKLVVNPFRKTFNPGEKYSDYESMKPDELVHVAKKHNGYMLSVSFFNGELLVSTTGTLDSDYAVYGRSYIEENRDDFDMLRAGETSIFEVCADWDPHIVPEKYGLYHIGQRNNDSSDLSFNKLKSPIQAKIGDVEKVLIQCRHEGYMCHTLVGDKVAKFKSPYYIVAKKVARNVKLSDSDLDFLIRTKFHNHPALKHGLDCIPNLKGLKEQEKLTIIREELDNKYNQEFGAFNEPYYQGKAV